LHKKQEALQKAAGRINCYGQRERGSTQN